jgi:hypothetical protein
MKRAGIAVACAAILAAMPVFVGTAAAEDLPAADEVVAKYLEAIGGKDKVTGFDSRIMKGQFNLVDMGMMAPMTMYMKGGDYLNVIELEGMGTALRGVSDGKAWQKIEAMGQIGYVDGADAAQLMREADMEVLANWNKHFESAETVAKEEVGEGEAYKVTFTPKEGEPVNYYFDAESGLAVKSTTMAQGLEASTVIGGLQRGRRRQNPPQTHHGRHDDDRNHGRKR